MCVCCERKVRAPVVEEAAQAPEVATGKPKYKSSCKLVVFWVLTGISCVPGILCLLTGVGIYVTDDCKDENSKEDCGLARSYIGQPLLIAGAVLASLGLICLLIAACTRKSERRRHYQRRAAPEPAPTPAS